MLVSRLKDAVFQKCAFASRSQARKFATALVRLHVFARRILKILFLL